MSNTLTVHFATIVAQQALKQLRREMTIIKRVRRDFDKEVATYGSAVLVPKFGALVANDKTPGSDVTKQDATSGSVSVTLNKHKEATFIIEDVEKAKSSNDLLAGYMGSAITAITEAVEDSLFALYSGLSTEIGTAGTDVTPAVVRLARLTLQNAKAPRAGRTLVLAPKDINALLTADSQFLASYNNTNDETKLREGIVGRYMGFDVVESTAVPVVTADNPDSTHNIAFHQDAFALVVRPLPSVPENLGAVAAVVFDQESGLAVRAVLSYNADALGVQCTLDVLYGVAEMRDELAVEVLS